MEGTVTLCPKRELPVSKCEKGRNAKPTRQSKAGCYIRHRDLARSLYLQLRNSAKSVKCVQEKQRWKGGNTLDSSAAPELEVEDCELLWVRVKLKGLHMLCLCAYYRPNVADETSLRKRGQSLERSKACVRR